MIKLGYPEKIAILAAGAVLSVFGMMDFTGITQWGTSPFLLYIGYAVAVIGLALVFIDLRADSRVMEDYGDMLDVQDALGSVPDDDYCVSLDGETEYADDTELCDLTAAGADVPEEA